MNRLHNVWRLKERRKQLRNSLTPAEALLWKNLQRSQLDDRKFRRQHSVGFYVLDFYCPACRLAVELDGQGHFDSTRSDYDVKRVQFLEQRALESFGLRISRYLSLLTKCCRLFKRTLSLQPQVWEQELLPSSDEEGMCWLSQHGGGLKDRRS